MSESQDLHPFLNTIISRTIKTQWRLCLYSEKRRNPLEKVLASHTVELSRNIGASIPDKRLACTLDSLAFLCTCLSRHQSVALSLTLPPGETRAIICIAQSDDVSEDVVVSFLSRLWLSLRGLAALKQTSGSVSRKPQGDVPSGEIDPVKAKATDLWIDLLCHGFENVRYRFLKRSGQFRDFIEWWEVQDHSQDNPLFIAALSDVFLCMGSLITHVSLKQLDPMDRSCFVDLARMLPRLHGLCQHLFNYDFDGGKSALHQWSRRYEIATKSYFRLRPYLVKCISAYDHAQVLLKFSGSTRVSRILRQDLYVKHIPPQYRSNALRPDSWKDYIEAVFVSAGASIDLRFNAAVEHACWLAEEECDNARESITYSRRSLTTAAERIRIHCACRLLSYHHENIVHGSDLTEGGADTKALPMNYIGSSKSMCYACNRYFLACNSFLDESFQFIFHTQHTDLRMYGPWAMPDLVDDSSARGIWDKFFKIISEDYVRYLFAKNILTKSISPQVQAEEKFKLPNPFIFGLDVL
ncbi:hypothetical protein BD410DRAFT_96584 [Rickenella mellea]|uniref:Uncharacterized protein n=1 Tax=Rickenella mellea TaxID=50990 RepID=A0A4Y7QAD3_9AGAM|nr:hypothetical protein BD410DRAFT_96584 [Rickenella mellea]